MPSDTEHRVWVDPSDQHVVVTLDGEVVADTQRPLLVHETGLADRWYVPEEDIVVDLVDSDTTTSCPWKGQARYRSMPGGPTDLAWSYPAPIADVPELAGHWSFWGDTVSIDVR